ncbi:MAG: endo-1,4-beta-xylanase, partial [Chromatiales bacterium]|nr:endo-1,4-beta-xylanase [Chromatiales bacterium]
MKTRWTLFAGLVAALIAGGCNVTAELGEPLPGDTVEDKVAECRLRELAPDGLHIGNVYNDWLINDASDAVQNAGLLSSRFDMVSPEYSLAMNEIWTSERAIDFAAVNRFFDFARAHGMRTRISHLLWHEAIPDWLEQGGYSASEVRGHVEWYVKTLLPYVVANYADVAREWNVVN